MRTIHLLITDVIIAAALAVLLGGVVPWWRLLVGFWLLSFAIFIAPRMGDGSGRSER